MSVWDNCKQQNCSILWSYSVIRGSLSSKLTAAWHLLLKRIFLKMDSIVKSFIQFSSVQRPSTVMSDSLQPHEQQHTRPPCPSSTPGVHPNSCASSRWCHPANSSSVVPFSSCPQSLPASGSFPMSWLFLVSRKRLCSQVYVIRIKTVKVFIPFSEVSKGWGCWQD